MYASKLIVPGLIVPGLAAGLATVLVIALAGQLSAEDSSGAKSNAATSDSHSGAATQQKLNIRYARASLRLARINLDQAIDSNRRIPRSVASTEVERLQELVKLSEDRLRQEMKAGESDQANMRIRTAAANADVATAELRKAESANRNLPGAVSDRDLERLRVTAELAQIALARERAAGDPKSSMAEIQLQLQQLRNEVDELRSAVNALTKRK